MSEPLVIHEDKNFLVVNKPAGLMVHGVRLSDKGQVTSDRVAKEPTLVDWLLKRYPEISVVGDDPSLRPGIVHRLDKDTSGVMLVARNQKTFAYLKSLFQKHEVKKTYLAIVVGVLKEREGTIDAPIGILTGSTRRSVHSKKMAKEAVTEYKVLRQATSDQRQGSISLLEVSPKTGRTHQIRVHLASIGHPIIGDKLYGSKNFRRRKVTTPYTLHPIPSTRLMLHALSIEFTMSDGKAMRFEAEPPREFEDMVPGFE